MRTLEDFEEALGSTETTVAVGSWVSGGLVAYSICRRSDRNPYSDVAYLEDIDPANSQLWIGLGTVVHPDFEGRLLMARLLNHRREILAKLNVEHEVGLAAVGNLSSIASIVRAGGILVGLARDENALNYVAYRGNLLNSTQFHGDPAPVNWTDIDGLQKLFRSGRVATDLERKGERQRNLILRSFELLDPMH